MARGLDTPLCGVLGIRTPILLAAMAGGPGSPALVAAVGRAGGLGVFGATGMTRETIAAAVRDAAAAADGAPVGVNAQLAPTTPATGDRAAILAVLEPFRRELGLPPEPPPRAPADPPEALIAAALDAGARVVTTFDDPAGVLDDVRRHDALLVPMVTTAAETRRALDAGAVAVIAQGAEAGGHRGTYGLGLPGVGPPPLVGTFALVPEVVAAVAGAVPVIASGGIMDGRGIAAAFALGAQGVSLGTRFLHAAEAGIAPAYRERLARLAAEETIVSDVVTGRPARWVRNRLVDALVESDVGTLGWPAQGALMADLRAAAAAQGRSDLLPMLAGQGVPPEATQRAEEIVAQLEREALGALGSGSATSS
jgi:nitronate monooxygenase